MASNEKTLGNMIKSLVRSEHDLRQAFFNIDAMVRMGGAPVSLLNDYNAAATQFDVSVREFLPLWTQITGLPPLGGTQPLALPRYVVQGATSDVALSSQITVAGGFGPAAMAASDVVDTGNPVGIVGLIIVAGLVLGSMTALVIHVWNKPEVERQITAQLQLRTTAEMMRMLTDKTMQLMAVCVGDPTKATPNMVNQCLSQISSNMANIKSGLPKPGGVLSGWSFLEVVGVIAAGGAAIVGGLWIYRKVTEIKDSHYQRVLEPYERGSRGRIQAQAHVIGPSHQLPAYDASYEGADLGGPRDDDWEDYEDDNDADKV